MSASEKLKKRHDELGWPPYNREVGESLLAVVEAMEKIERELKPLYAGPNSFGAHLQSAKNAARESLDGLEKILT